MNVTAVLVIVAAVTDKVSVAVEAVAVKVKTACPLVAAAVNEPKRLFTSVPPVVTAAEYAEIVVPALLH